MPRRFRIAIIATLTAVSSMLAVLPVAAATQKVVIIVGPTGAQTQNYRDKGDEMATTAEAAGAIVVKVYSPSATWANVKAAVNGANIVVYLGHGNGFPNPYSSTENADRVNGWGLNRTTSGGDSDDWSAKMVYCGEKALRGTLTSSDGAAQRTYCAGGPITPAANWVMIYSNACYAPGASEGWDTPATESVAYQRVRHYSFPYLALGAGAYFATDFGGGAAGLIDDILDNPGMPFGAMAENANGYDFNAQRHAGHPDVSGARIWIQKTGGAGQYKLGYAGVPGRTPSGTTVAYTEPPAPAVGSGGPQINRIGGADRYAVAANVSASFSPGVPVAYVAVGTKFPDALTAGPAAAHEGGPVLLTQTNSLPASVSAELSRLAPQRIVVAGGPVSVSNAVLAQLDAYTTGSVTRIGGADRYAVAAGISAATFSPGVEVAYLAVGTKFPDALSAGPAAAHFGGPVLLTETNTLPPVIAAELSRLNPGRIVVAGGPASVSDGVLAQLHAYTSGSVTRIGGADRYAVSAGISASFASPGTVFLATGANFPDALSGVPAAAALDRPMLLTMTGSVPASVAAEVQRLAPARIYVLGGPASVSDAVFGQLEAMLE